MSDTLGTNPLSPEDETMNVGATKVILSLLNLYGIIVEKPADQMSTKEGEELLNFQLAQGYKVRHLDIIGDGLSQIHMKMFIELIKFTAANTGMRTQVYERVLSGYSEH